MMQQQYHPQQQAADGAYGQASKSQVSFFYRFLLQNGHGLALFK